MTSDGGIYFRGPAFTARCTDSKNNFEVLDETTGQWKQVTDIKMIQSIIQDGTIISSSKLTGVTASVLPSSKIPRPLPPVQPANPSLAPRIGGLLKILRMMPK